VIGVIAVLSVQIGGAGAVKPARCTITTTAGDYVGPCLFHPEGKGSFTVTRADDKAFLADVVSASLIVTAQGRGEVRGVTRSGLNSRWGTVRRDARNKACWKGADFRICVS
jgi:hypothetical protein